MIRDARNGFMVLVALMGQYLAANETSQSSGARFDPPLQLRASIPDIGKCRQLIVVTTEDWNATSATIRLFERTQGERTSWQKVGKPFSGVIGRRGFAWGIGLHGTGEAGASRKREGDETSPAGVFRLCSVFGLANPAQVRFLRFPYQQITATTEAIDDPQSRYYNRIVDRAAIARFDCSSSESMLCVGGPYRCGIMIEHNWRQIPRSGSCIFLHVWNSSLRGTAGCTAVSSAHLEQLLHWIDVQNNPLIIQLPLPEYVFLRQSWGLP
jgi:D-alanyl-D-alanine dipeptidase